MPSAMNLAFLKLQRRAEQGDPDVLARTFVDVGSLATVLRTQDHQVLYGRRGTGKTHALHYLRSQVEAAGDITAYIDLRTIGSAGGVYGDPSLPVAERGTRLLSDVLAQIVDRLQGYVLSRADDVDLTQAMSLLDRLDDAAVDVRVTGEVAQEKTNTDTSTRGRGLNLKLKASPTSPPSAEAGADASRQDARQDTTHERVVGTERHHVQFGQVAKYLGRLIGALPANRLWILLDEWVAVPVELQPLLADLLRRAVLPVPGVTVKVAAIEQRSHFRVEVPGDYLGFELGADIQADLDLDDYMVFDNDAEKSKEFFRALLFRHVVALMEEESTPPPSSPMELQKQAFTQRNAIDDFVRAAEGVPRDAINILRLAAQRADDNPIAVEHIRGAARRWYLQNKEKEVPADAKALLHWIIDEVIDRRRARAFLLEQGEGNNDPLISALYDARVLHVIRRGIAAQDRAGVRFDVYAIDYGSYVEYINTARATQGLFETENDEGAGEWVDVPGNDYRSIRRAILELDKYETRQMALTEDPDSSVSPTTR